MTGPSLSGARTAVVVGAGLAGTLMAIMLAGRGFAVRLHEQRADPRHEDTPGDDRSINLGMSARALYALGTVGLRDTVLALSVPMRGRLIHRERGGDRWQPYGVTPDEILYAVRRRDLNTALLARAAAHPGVRLFFRSRFVGLAKGPKPIVLRFAEGRDGTVRPVEADLVVGADGAFSAVRRAMQHGERADYSQQFLAWGHKELTIPASACVTPRLDLNALHVWPRPSGLVVAHPNRDGSLTATLFLAHEGEPSFSSLTTSSTVRQFFGSTFPEIEALVPELPAQFLSRPNGQLVTVRTRPWYHRDGIVLIGDAAHAVYPFYGQGMNAALEDCVVLDQCLSASPRDVGGAFAHFQWRRKRHTDVLADLSEQNFAEFRDGMRTVGRLLRWRADITLNRLFPERWVPLYTLVSHTTTPYADALLQARRQDRTMALAAAAAGAVAAGATWAALSRGPGTLSGCHRPSLHRRTR
ncbi:kynurenine 3-monooxygenase [Streptomyces ruber]|uniref:Kynurenine 3-monooxygenase n=2 Tax=Streptomyces TaxID=1883 RepID=A0A918BLQ0_9ACTN|nr:NAD(P)/FAD-dependent oxidoreductase [Streptomyces ruber]GGQ72941.1 kynurenine 3-monooxygenase [Streptomyces ruber]